MKPLKDLLVVRERRRSLAIEAKSSRSACCNLPPCDVGEIKALLRGLAAEARTAEEGTASTG